MSLGGLVKHVFLAVGLLALLVLPARAPWTVVRESAAASAAKTGRTTSDHADFNGDGFADLAIGVPHEDVGSTSDAGAVQVVYGSPVGLTAANDQFWTQDSTFIRGTGEPGDDFGWALAAGDFSGDGRADLAIGVPGEEVRGIRGAGAVNTLHGSAAGLDAANNQMWNQYLHRVKDEPELLDAFGSSVVSR